MRSVLFKHLSSLGIIDYDDMICEKEGYFILYRDILNRAIMEKISGTNQHQKADELTEKIVSDMKERGVLILDSWAVMVEDRNCRNCPAFKWVIHRDGVHPCRLGFDIEQDHPVNPCIRPQTIGASYVIARELGRPEPMVGKLDKKMYDQYVAEKEKAEAAVC